MKDSWIWLVFGGTIAAYVGVAIALLTGGAMFSSLFVIDDDDYGMGDEEVERQGQE